MTPDFFAAEAWDLRGAALARLGYHREALFAFQEAYLRTPMETNLDETLHGLPIEVVRKIWYAAMLFGSYYGMYFADCTEVPRDTLALLDEHGEGDIPCLTRPFWEDLQRRAESLMEGLEDFNLNMLTGFETAVRLGVIQDV